MASSKTTVSVRAASGAAAESLSRPQQVCARRAPRVVAFTPGRLGQVSGLVSRLGPLRSIGRAWFSSSRVFEFSSGSSTSSRSPDPCDLFPGPDATGLIPLEGRKQSSNFDFPGAGDSVLNERMAELRAAGELRKPVDEPTATRISRKNVLAEVLTFAVPALGSVLADPLMSLVDTACVGQYSSLHLAALAPNTSVFNLFFQLFTFLGYTTTNLIASNSSKLPGLTSAEKAEKMETASRVLAHSMVLAAVSGLTCTVIMFSCGPALLNFMGATPETLGPALSYLQIRALASPAVMIANVAQGACLGQQDAWTPLKVFATSGVVNLVLDMFLISRCGMGIAGAAVATTFAQVVAASYFIWYCWSKGEKGEAVPLKWHGLPTMKSLAPFWEVANTLLGRTMMTCLAYTGVSTLSASMGFIAAASHQVALQVFWFLSYVPESVSLTAQSLLARDLKIPAKARMITHTLMQLSGVIGVVLSAMFVGSMLGCPGLFSSDAAVHTGLKSIVIPGTLAITVLTLVMCFDGISIGSGRFKHLPLANMVGLISCMTVALLSAHMGFGLTGTWAGLSAFTLGRLGVHLMVHGKQWGASLFGNGRMKMAYA